MLLQGMISLSFFSLALIVPVCVGVFCLAPCSAVVILLPTTTHTHCTLPFPARLIFPVYSIIHGYDCVRVSRSPMFSSREILYP
jgi:hypothetical protein